MTITERIAAIRAIKETDLTVPDLGLGDWIRETTVGQDVYGNPITAYKMYLVERTSIYEIEGGERVKMTDLFSPCGRFRFVRFGDNYHRGGTLEYAAEGALREDALGEAPTK